MSKLSVTLFFIGLSLFVVCDGSALFAMSGGSSDSLEPTQLNFFQKMSEQCRNNTGSDAAFSVLMESFETFSKCMSKFDTKNFQIDFDQLSNATRTAFFSKYCSEARPLISCFDDVETSLRPCLKTGGFKVIEGFFKSIPEALDLVCKNDGEIIFKLKDETRKKCFMQKGELLSACVNTYATSSIWNDDWNAEFTQDKCSILASYRQCLKEPMDACDLSDLISIYDVSMNAMLRRTPCLSNTTEPKDETHQNNSTDEV